MSLPQDVGHFGRERPEWHTSLISNTRVTMHPTSLSDGLVASVILLEIFCPALSGGNALLSTEQVPGPES